MEAIEIYDIFENKIKPNYGDKPIKLDDYEDWKVIESLSDSDRMKIATIVLNRLLDRLNKKYFHTPFRKKIFKSIINSVVKIELDTIEELLANTYEEIIRCGSNLPVSDIVYLFKHGKKSYPETDLWERIYEKFLEKFKGENYPEKNFKDLMKGLEAIIEEDIAFYDTKDFLGYYLNEKINSFPIKIKDALSLCWSEKQKSEPTKSWINKAQEIILKSPITQLEVETITDFFDFIIQHGKKVVKILNSDNYDKIDTISAIVKADFKNDDINNYYYRPQPYFGERNEVGFSYFIWFCSLIPDDKVYKVIQDVALSSFAKVNGEGSLSTKNGNACLYAFTLMPEKRGIVQLLNLKNKTSNKNIKNLASKHIEKKAKALGLSENSLIEFSTSDFGIKDNQIKIYFGSSIAIIETKLMSNPSLSWYHNEKYQSSIPKEIQENLGEEIKRIKAVQKEINTTYLVHKKRLEALYLDTIKWTIEEWENNYEQHPFLSTFCESLIWFLDKKTTVIKSGNYWIDENYNVIDIKNYADVELWHPRYSKIDTIKNWRNFILEKEIKQPFKQAFREVYILTDAERNTDSYSNRFAAHILYQHQFLALAKQLNWNYTLQGGFDSHNIPHKTFPAKNISVQYQLEPIQDSLFRNNIFTYVGSGQVVFYNTAGIILLKDVPSLIFTEAMRNIDMFVGVSSVGNNPNWEETGLNMQSWTDQSFSELTQRGLDRKHLLESIIPKLKIANQCTFDQKYLIVKGKKRSYKIHLGSGNILMTPNDQYLCIVPDQTKSSPKLFLPFDEDRVLNIILSKALMLAEDDKIKDGSINSQINF